MAFELVLERKGSVRRKGVQAAETKGTTTENHEQVTRAWPVLPHSPAEGSRRRPERSIAGDKMTKGVSLAQELSKAVKACQRILSRDVIESHSPPHHHHHPQPKNKDL